MQHGCSRFHKVKKVIKVTWEMVVDEEKNLCLISIRVRRSSINLY